MPEAWSNLLKHSGITRDEKQKNPQAVVKALEFYTRTSQTEENSKFLTAQRYGINNINNSNNNMRCWLCFCLVYIISVQYICTVYNTYSVSN